MKNKQGEKQEKRSSSPARTFRLWVGCLGENVVDHEPSIGVLLELERGEKVELARGDDILCDRRERGRGEEGKKRRRGRRGVCAARRGVRRRRRMFACLVEGCLGCFLLNLRNSASVNEKPDEAGKGEGFPKGCCLPARREPHKRPGR